MDGSCKLQAREESRKKMKGERGEGCWGVVGNVKMETRRGWRREGSCYQN